VIPMPDTVIARVNALGTDQPKQLIFTNWRGCPIPLRLMISTFRNPIHL
jgi:hypothetical protein